MKNEKIKKKRKKINFLLALIFIVIFVIIGIGIFYISRKKEVIPAEVENYVKKYINLYIGLINISVEKVEKYDGGYRATVNAVSASGLVSLELYLYENLTPYKMTQIIQLPEKPKTIIEIPYKISCSKEKIAIDIYIDPYDPWSRKYDDLIQNFIDNRNVSEIWRIIATQSYKFEGKDSENAFLLLKYFECMKGKENFKEFRKCIYNKIDELKQSESKTINESEIMECIGNVDVKKCLDEDSIRELRVDESFALTYLQTPTTPMIVMDCKYKTWPTFVENVYCYLYKC
jgi:hypothetical protein